ncbi:polyphosphate polymerase domain-containing protein [Clostridium sp. SHJSY1]|uniref:polyphosphate polymerase domain-containing protein n=1 Tax=Clostridium sp. SHJSY1 TaxID=2942483 RepID=UPI0028766B25|nr:polyphosphate polymerase domain-containing protein [Clostridium sp. SHJSY1]MDS0525436.1 polyphosphate polymerase domain-containing protein [Clostridium sp. SHJSY1]
MAMLDVLRQEKKYLMSLSETRILYGLLSKVLHEDEHNKSGGYLVRSLYFDTPFDHDYYEKEDGLDNRKKIRIRVYSSKAKTAKLEMKEKFGNDQRKRSLTISQEQALDMINGNFEFLISMEESFAMELYLLMSQKLYRPKCVVEYDRTAFIVPENNTRVTFDMNIRASESDFNIFSDDLILYPVTSPDDVTIEVKFNNFLLGYVKDLLDSCGKIQVSNSKYVLSRSMSYF